MDWWRRGRTGSGAAARYYVPGSVLRITPQFLCSLMSVFLGGVETVPSLAGFACLPLWRFAGPVGVDHTVTAQIAEGGGRVGFVHLLVGCASPCV